MFPKYLFQISMRSLLPSKVTRYPAAILPSVEVSVECPCPAPSIKTLGDGPMVMPRFEFLMCQWDVRM